MEELKEQRWEVYTLALADLFKYDFLPFFCLILYNYLWVVVIRRELRKYSITAQDAYDESFDTYDLSVYKP